MLHQILQGSLWILEGFYTGSIKALGELSRYPRLEGLALRLNGQGMAMLNPRSPPQFVGQGM